jgi:hypothetical protein
MLMQFLVEKIRVENQRKSQRFYNALLPACVILQRFYDALLESIYRDFYDALLGSIYRDFAMPCLCHFTEILQCPACVN